jgi:hypothetical protein
MDILIVILVVIVLSIILGLAPFLLDDDGLDFHRPRHKRQRY